MCHWNWKLVQYLFWNGMVKIIIMENRVLIPPQLILQGSTPSSNSGGVNVSRLLDDQVIVISRVNLEKGQKFHPIQNCTVRCGSLDVYSTLSPDDVSIIVQVCQVWKLVDKFFFLPKNPFLYWQVESLIWCEACNFVLIRKWLSSIAILWFVTSKWMIQMTTIFFISEIIFTIRSNRFICLMVKSGVRTNFCEWFV